MKLDKPATHFLNSAKARLTAIHHELRQADCDMNRVQRMIDSEIADLKLLKSLLAMLECRRENQDSKIVRFPRI